MATPQPHFANLIHSYMRARHLNQAEAARLCGFSESQMSSLLKRPRRNWPEPETVNKLYRGLGIPCGETMDAAAKDLGVGPLLDEALRISEDPDVRATAHALDQLPEQDRRRLTAIARAYLDNRDDKK